MLKKNRDYKISQLPSGLTTMKVRPIRQTSSSDKNLLESYQRQVDVKFDRLNTIKNLLKSRDEFDNYKFKLFAIFAFRSLLERPKLDKLPEHPQVIERMNILSEHFQLQFGQVKKDFFDTVSIEDAYDLLDAIEVENEKIKKFDARINAFLRFYTDGNISDKQIQGVINKMHVPPLSLLKDAGVEYSNLKDQFSLSEDKIPLTDNHVIMAAEMSGAVYDENPKVDSTKWSPIQSESFDMPDGYTNDGKFINNNAVAFIQETEIDGKKTLMLAFKGTDMFSPKDWLDNIAHINRHYNHMRPFVESIDDYIKANDIDHVITTGHSLGGAMAAIYMHEHHDNSNVKFSGISFGSPGAVFPKWATDDRLFCFRHLKDPIPSISNFRKLLGKYESPGLVVGLEDNSDRFSGFLSFFKAHSVNEYISSVKTAVKEDNLYDVLNNKKKVANISVSPTQERELSQAMV